MSIMDAALRAAAAECDALRAELARVKAERDGAQRAFAIVREECDDGRCPSAQHERLAAAQMVPLAEMKALQAERDALAAQVAALREYVTDHQWCDVEVQIIGDARIIKTWYCERNECCQGSHEPHLDACRTRILLADTAAAAADHDDRVFDEGARAQRASDYAQPVDARSADEWPLVQRPEAEK